VRNTRSIAAGHIIATGAAKIIYTRITHHVMLVPMRVMITGMTGFIAHHIVEDILKNTDWEVVGLDRLDLSGTFHRLTDIEIWEKEKHRVFFAWHDLKAPVNQFVAKQLGHIDVILHLAASTHVDRSIDNPMEFVMDNVVATANLLDYARAYPVKQILYFSTDEVFGPAPEGVAYKEWDRYNSGNPYAATKAGGEELCLAYANTYNLPVFITHTMNVFGERQHPEKFIPMVIRKVLNGEKVTVHGNKEKTKAGSRFYIHCRNVAAAVRFLLERATKGEKYNIVGEKEIDNLALAQFIASVVGKPLLYEMVDFHSSRPGHDLRYALDGSKLAQMGWAPPKTFEASMEKTVQWYLNPKHRSWLLL